ncbi:hypothetical protein BG005_007190 [Podila minutissima]|nr:hypothetical protein BG005_007190 [Podila minutissima]
MTRDTLHPSSLSTVQRRASTYYRPHDDTHNDISVTHTRTNNNIAYLVHLRNHRITYQRIAHVGTAYIDTTDYYARH